MWNKIIYIIVFMLQLNMLGGQITRTSVLENTETIPSDTLTANDSVIVKNAFFKLFQGKPGRAALYSLVLPGAGQIYNRKYWKAPIAWAIDGALIYNLWYQSSQYNTFQELYRKALESNDINVLVYKSNRDKFRKAKEFGWLYLLAGHLLTTMDAYVDRHLMEFDISPELSYHGWQDGPTIGLAVRVPLNTRSSMGAR